MVAPDEREQVLAGELDEIERGLDQKDSDMLSIYEGSKSVHPWAGLAAPITLSELKRCFLESSYFERQIVPNPGIETAYLATTSQGQVVITFDPETFDRFPNSLRLFSYGDQVLAELLSRVPSPENDEHQGIVCFSSTDSIPLKAYYGLNQQNQPIRLQTLQDLLNIMEDGFETMVWSEVAFQSAKQDFEQYLVSTREEYESITNLRFQSTHSALVEKAVQIVYRAALLELIQGGHFSSVEDAWRAVTTNEQTVQSLLRHGYPFTALLRLTATRLRESNMPTPLPDDFANTNPEQLRRLFLSLKQEGQALLERLGRTQDRREGQTHGLNAQAHFFRT